MSADTNRLREAADKILWDSTFLQESDFPELQNERRQKERVAALLRAVAEYHPVECSFARYGHVCTPYCPRCRAEALADTILGVES